MVAIAAFACGCGEASGTTRETNATTATTSVTTSGAASTEPEPTTTSLSPTSTAASTETSTLGQPEQTIYRPEPIREGDRVIAPIVPVDGVTLDDSSVALRIVDYADGRFLELDLTDAVVPENAAFWTTSVNGRQQGLSTARQGSTMGHRLDRDMYGDTLTVTFSAITSDGTVLATTGEVQIVDDL